MQLTMKLKHGTQFKTIAIPRDISIPALKSWIGKPCVLEAKDGDAKTYAYGNEEVRGLWETGKHVVSMEIFCFNYQYGFNAFARQEAREERIAICETEGVPPSEIEAILHHQPHLYEKEKT